MTLKARLQQVHWIDPATDAEDRLSAKQVLALVQLAATWGPATRSRAPAIGPIRDRLADLSKNVRGAAKMLEGMRVGSATSPELRETYNRLALAASDADLSEDFQSVEKTLTRLADVADRARQALPRQRRHDRADWQMVERIWGAIVANQPEQDDPGVLRAVQRLNAAAGASGQRVIAPRKPFTLRLSSSETSAFREICGAVFEEMTGQKDADPERALREFIKRRKARRDARSKKTAA